jgi:hypothetical protein
MKQLQLCILTDFIYTVFHLITQSKTQQNVNNGDTDYGRNSLGEKYDRKKRY